MSRSLITILLRGIAGTVRFKRIKQPNHPAVRDGIDILEPIYLVCRKCLEQVDAGNIDDFIVEVTPFRDTRLESAVSRISLLTRRTGD